MAIAPVEKRCRRCGETRPLEAGFYRHAQMKDGHLNICVACKRREAKEHRDANIDRVRAYDRRRGFRGGSHPDRVQARNAVGAGLLSGEIVKPDTCSRCGDDGKIEAHHHDYEKPLDVEWLCIKCHRSLHRKYGSF